MKGSENKFSGFTLIELMIALMVIGLIATLVFPSFNSIELSRLKGEARRIQSAIEFTYDLSVMEKINYRLAFDLDKQCFSAERKEGEQYVPAKNELLIEHCLPDSVWIEELEILDRNLNRSGKEYIYFSPFGYSEPARIYLTNDTNDSRRGYTIFTQPATGQVKVYEGLVQYKDIEEHEQF